MLWLVLTPRLKLNQLMKHYYIRSKIALLSKDVINVLKTIVHGNTQKIFWIIRDHAQILKTKPETQRNSTLWILLIQPYSVVMISIFVKVQAFNPNKDYVTTQAPTPLVKLTILNLNQDINPRPSQSNIFAPTTYHLIVNSNGTKLEHQNSS